MKFRYLLPALLVAGAFSAMAARAEAGFRHHGCNSCCAAPACEASCAAAEPSCAAPAPACAPAAEPSCAAAPSCAAEPSCCAAPSCCQSSCCRKHHCRLFGHHCCKPKCCAPVCAPVCAPACAPTCCASEVLQEPLPSSPLPPSLLQVDLLRFELRVELLRRLSRVHAILASRPLDSIRCTSGPRSPSGGPLVFFTHLGLTAAAPSSWYSGR